MTTSYQLPYGNHFLVRLNKDIVPHGAKEGQIFNAKIDKFQIGEGYQIYSSPMYNINVPESLQVQDVKTTQMHKSFKTQEEFAEIAEVIAFECIGVFRPIQEYDKWNAEAKKQLELKK